MTSQSIRKISRYFVGLLVFCWVPYLESVLIKDKPLLAQNIQSEQQVLYVNPNEGDDLNSGTRRAPLKTITSALKLAKANTLISLAPGTYSKVTGEVFPLLVGDRVTLQGVLGGNGRNVMVMGGGSFLSRTGAGQNVAIAALRNSTAIKGLTIINPHDRGHGLWVESASPEIRNNTFTHNGNTGLSVNGRSKSLITDNFFRNNGGNGLLIYGQSSPTVTDNKFENTGFGVSLVQQAQAVIVDNEFRGNRIGVIFEGNSQGKLRGNQILTSWDYGLVAIANSKVDLGNSQQSGENVFRRNRQLAIQNITNNVISAYGTEVQGATEGQIDFSDGSISAVTIDDSATNLANNNRASRLRDNPLAAPRKIIKRSLRETTNQQVTIANPPRSSFTSSPEDEGSTADQQLLPPPPALKKPKPLSPRLSSSRLRKNPQVNTEAENNSTKKEFVFTAPRNSIVPSSQAAQPNLPNSRSRILPETLTKKAVGSSVAPLRSPSVLGNNINRGNVNSLSDLLGSSRAANQFRVLVEAEQSDQQQKTLSLYPNAKRTVYQGKLMLQVGVFGDRTTAEKVSRSLANLRLTSYILD